EELISYPRFTKEELDGTVVNKGREVFLTTKGKKEYEVIKKSEILEMNFHLESFRNLVPFASNKIVFLAHRFNEIPLRDKIVSELRRVNFDVKEGKLEDLGYISEDILNKIKESGFFLALLTPSKEFKNSAYSTSSWILMEIGAAIAFGRKVLILSEDCIDQDEYAGKLQRDCEYTTFNRSNFDDKLKVAIARITKEWEKQN
ncbi:MAG: toll/interleukin-1 receptor domain-containing protein, partial [Candidatus Omnitrophica bacterium]|nr:toll/interleukin-1 receptor domain-containing protein [Candidatus Omnitrophota bacterium]